MKYFKYVKDNYIIEISTNNGITEISEDEYDKIFSIITNPPNDIDIKEYKLNSNTLQWEFIGLIQNNIENLDN